MITRTNQILIAAALMAAAPAAAVTYTSVNGAPDKGPAAGETILVDFNTDTLPTGFAAPAGDATRFLYTSTKIPNGTATLSTLDLTSVSFYWGSIDKYNFVDVLGAGGETLFTLGGGALAPADGNQTAGWTNRRVFFTAEGDELISGLRFRSTGVAFEVDDVAGTVFDGGSGATVPEPATWAMMVMGFGLVGFARRRRAHNLTQATA